jgi:hypothetical protein
MQKRINSASLRIITLFDTNIEEFWSQTLAFWLQGKEFIELFGQGRFQIACHFLPQPVFETAIRGTFWNSGSFYRIWLRKGKFNKFTIYLIIY